MSEPKEGRGFADDFDRILSLDFRHGIGAHGAPMLEDAKAKLSEQVARLYGPAAVNVQ
jgi:hypothetical protein